MEVQATTAQALASGADTIAIGIFEGEAVGSEEPGELLARLLQRGEAGAETGRIAVAHVQETRVLLLGLGPRARFDAERGRAAAALAHGRARELRARRLAWQLPHGVGSDIAGGLVEGTLLAAYRFTAFKRAPKRPAPELEALLVCGADDAAVARAALVATAQNRARDLGNRPANELTPAALADYATGLDGRDGITVGVMDGEAIRRVGMGAFAAVAQGSAQSPRLIELRYDGSGEPDAPLLGLVGKAVTFDSGGLSLKPAATMHEMKFDMCGGAAVIEAVAALAALRAPVRV
ncbi:MAG: leucyl aminopeptidase, partial [Solirubrobacteraceae bacterium]|nr:leucyl aminopeptidase [Solirubrobacteraceae bacterium]